MVFDEMNPTLLWIMDIEQGDVQEPTIFSPEEEDSIWDREEPSYAKEMVERWAPIPLRRYRGEELIDPDLKASIEKNGFAPEKFGRTIYK